jgi:hypothetical protein
MTETPDVCTVIEVTGLPAAPGLVIRTQVYHPERAGGGIEIKPPGIMGINKYIYQVGRFSINLADLFPRRLTGYACQDYGRYKTKRKKWPHYDWIKG